MIKREFKINFKNLSIWLLVLLLINILVYSMYPSLSEVFSNNFEEIMNAFPKEMLTAFNMDISSITTAFGWFKTEGLVLFMLVYGIYASILGSNILLKEESDGTIEYLYSKPITRNEIVMSKIISGLINIIIMNLFMTLITSLGLLYNNDLELFMVIKLNTVLLIPTIILFFISLCISTFFKKTKQVNALSFGIVFLSYFLYSFSALSEEIKFLKYLSVYTLSDIREVIQNNSINILYTVLAILIVVIISIVIFVRYNKKELV